MGDALDACSHDRRSHCAHQQISDRLITGYGVGLMEAIPAILQAHRFTPQRAAGESTLNGTSEQVREPGRRMTSVTREISWVAADFS
jgi:hypothetical protein